MGVLNKLIDIVNEDKTAFETHTHTIPEIITKGTATTQTAENVTVPKTNSTFADEMDNIKEDDLLKA